MSVEIPKMAVVFGSVTPPQGDIIDCRVHLGCTKEVGSFECLLQNWNKKYSPGGTYPITVGLDGHIDIGRGTNVPQIITLRVESVKCESSPTENYIRVSGRCWGEKLFRRVITKTYDNKKGEEIVKDLLDYYVGLSHVRDSTELVENTDTTYTHLAYENTPVWDIIKYIAESSDLAGVIGYDFRVAPDGKFEFFPKNSKTSSVSLSEKIEVSEYRKDILRVRNRIRVYGCQGKNFPANLDLWSESLDGWTTVSGSIELDARSRQGTYCLRLNAPANVVGNIYRTFNTLVKPQTFVMWAWMPGNLGGGYGYVRLFAPDSANYFQANISSLLESKCILQWGLISLGLGPSNMYDANNNPSGVWTKVGNPQWSQISGLQLIISALTVSTYIMYDGDFGFLNCSYTGTAEDSASQSAYGLRELTETDEELTSDNECNLRAKALLDYLKNPAESLTLTSTVIDYGTTPPLAADKIHVTLPNENIDSDFRIESVEYYVNAKTQTLEITLELGKVPPMLADYLYGLRATTVTVEKLARTKLGKGVQAGGVGGFGGGGGGIGFHHVGHEAGDNNGVQWPSQDEGGWDKITGWICPKHIGPFDDAAAIINFRTKNKAGTAVLDHQLRPSDDAHGVFGAETAKWKEVHTLYLLLYTDGYMQIKTVGEANPKVRLSANMLQFGAGGASALDTWLKRIAANQFESSGDIIPDGDNVRSLGLGGATPKRWANIYAVNINLSSHLIPGADNTYDIGEGTTPKRWRDLYLAGAIKALGGGVAVNLLPNANATYDLGSSTLKWSNLYLSGVCDVGGWLNVAGFTVITNARVLQNVTAAAGIITSGQFPLARMPRGDAGKFLRAYGADYDPMYAFLAAGDIPSLDASKITSGRFPLARFPEGTAGYVLEAEGAGFDPMYVNPNGRYTPASHTHSHASLTGVGPNDHHAQVHNHAGEALSPDSIAVNTLSVAVSVNCKNWVHADILFNNEFRITEAENVNLGHGLVFLNPKGKVIMLIDGNGNVEIFGKLKQQSSRLKSLWRKMKQNAKKVIKP